MEKQCSTCKWFATRIDRKTDRTGLCMYFVANVNMKPQWLDAQQSIVKKDDGYECPTYKAKP